MILNNFKFVNFSKMGDNEIKGAVEGYKSE